MAGAELRRKEYEGRLKDKLNTETRKPLAVMNSMNSSFTETTVKIKEDAEDKMRQNVENRAAHLKQMRDRLKAKDDRAKQVRERKMSLQQAIAIETPIAAL